MEWKSSDAPQSVWGILVVENKSTAVLVLGKITQHKRGRKGRGKKREEQTFYKGDERKMKCSILEVIRKRTGAEF